ncbi:MAG TPA: STAS domain-containing protein [bacterium]|nr:STAS domain-containing protein [bacterium]HPQ67074.1 STAS domain-containing protein [bacterium]
MNISINENSGYLQVDLEGNFDANWSQAFSDRIDFALQENRQGRALDLDLVIDLSGVSYISSGGIRVLLALHRKMQGAGRRLALCDPGPQVSQVMRISGMYDLFAFYPSVGAAERHLREFRP